MTSICVGRAVVALKLAELTSIDAQVQWTGHHSTLLGVDVVLLLAMLTVLS